jgi:hypothetical protein
MYRIKAWSGYFYRCAGHYPERKGCGNMVPLAITDAAVTALLSMAHEPWTELRPVPGENHDVEIADIKLAMRDLGAQDLPDNEYDAELRRLRAERDRLAALPNIPDQWKDVEFCATCGGSVWQDACEAAEHSKITIGQHFKGLDPDGQRAMLLENVKLYAELGPSDPELSKLAAKPYRVPILRMESRLFRMPVEWIGPSEPQTV